MSGSAKFWNIIADRSRLPKGMAAIRVRMMQQLRQGPARADVTATTKLRPVRTLDEARRIVDERSRPPLAGIAGYMHVEHEHVDPTIRRAAAQGRDGAVASLGQIDKPDIRYFRRARSGEVPDIVEHRDLRGYFDQGTNVIHVSTELTTAEARSTAAHEVSHRFGRDETQARTFEHENADTPVDLWSVRR